MNDLNCIGIHGKIDMNNKNISFNHQELNILKDMSNNKELSVGFNIIIEKNKNNVSNEVITIINILDENKIEDTYCFNEHQEHAGILMVY